MKESPFRLQPIAAENLGCWRMSFPPHRPIHPSLLSLSRCVVHQLIKFMNMQLHSSAEIIGCFFFPERVLDVGLNFCILIDTVQQLVCRNVP